MIDSTLSLFAKQDTAADERSSDRAPEVTKQSASSADRRAPAQPTPAPTPADSTQALSTPAQSARASTLTDSAPISPPASADAELAERATYVNTLYERHRPALFRYLHGLLRRTADAEDVLQETYARLLSGAPLDRDDGRCRAYIFKIATNLAYDRHRRRTELRLEDRPPEDEPSGVGDAPDVIVDFEQAFAVVKRTLLELKPWCRQVFLLRASEELGYETIAERLGVSKRTVEREMQHALEVLQSRLKRSRR
jgi:RNA polymerase sigma-70 factor (ECF subfamily)